MSEDGATREKAGAPERDEAVIRGKGIVRTFGSQTVIDGVDFEVREGEIFGLIGPSGSGKSTLMRMLTGYLKPSGGEVRVFGRDPFAFDATDRRLMSFMPQSFVLDGGLSVRQNMNFVAGLYGLRFGRRRKRVREALEFVELWEHRRKSAQNLSGGMQRRLQLAAAILHEPKLVFVDEPTANLDPILRRKFWEEFRLLAEMGRTLFVTTQYVGEAELCDRVALLHDGKLVAVGPPEELRRRAFGGETIELTLGEDPGMLGEHLPALERIGRVVEVREEPGQEGTSRLRLVVENSDRALPKVFEALRDAEVRSADLIYPSFDEVFFRLIHGSRSPGF
ncbi:ABC-type multidrug transport system ATPase component [Rubrobacter radiotolerans]|uniref:ABC transporter ATP-binding protein n=1 Tax=Rubrobacter radiotolerans TaxID=42256 RepID=A0A023X672_RUBRA|nr:ABC transporter ATP-binding protein [Rubrobacter radiotolerans]AHY47962.1 ABC-type multidrug transport system ATPase component [Rubrobacter radiotolerans]MDX5892600.1 ABC transporter ATP-binding protein [Rubrobacter radiotolerans]SMC07906.1 ABC-2 type transport system ATP-binding protein [Rubrobacter radiotolerans DSM 5868]